ncbi:hypothetical protein MMC11_005784 [Xylographa trunciseda]|nr:hypothetical protein [Xylographa trunciseda]
MIRHVANQTSIVGLCQLAGGSFLTNVGRCYETSCDSTADFEYLLSDLDSGCQLMGISIPSAAMSSAEAVASGFSPSTETIDSSSVTNTDISRGESVATAMASMTTWTAKMKETNSMGQVTIVEVPEVFDGTTTIIGKPSTTNPVIISTTGSITPESLGSTTSFAPSATFVDSTLEPSNMATTSLGALLTASTSTSSAAAATPSEGNGSLFTSQNAARKQSTSSLLGLTIGLVAGIAWY